MSRQQENKNLLRKRQTRRPRLKPGSEREGHIRHFHTRRRHRSSVTYLQIFTTNFNFCKFYIVQILKESSQWKSCNKILAFTKIAL
jgi:hypothetical protein